MKRNLLQWKLCPQMLQIADSHQRAQGGEKIKPQTVRSNYDFSPLFFYHLEMTVLCSRPGCAITLQLHSLHWENAKVSLYGTKVLSQFCAQDFCVQDFCVHSVIMTDCATYLCRISFKTQMKPVHILSRFLQRPEYNLSLFEEVGSEGFSPVAFYM